MQFSRSGRAEDRRFKNTQQPGKRHLQMRIRYAIICFAVLLREHIIVEKETNP